MKLKLYILLLFTSSLFAQKVTTSIDTTKNKIGAEFKLTIKADVDTLSKVVFPKATTIGALEVIQSYKIDTIRNGNRYELIKKYGLTQFDSGKYAIPRLPILINGKPVFSDSLKIEINDVKVDTLKQRMYDIKNIATAENESNWWKYLLGLLLIIGIGALVYWLFKKYQKREKILEIVYTSPIEKATSLLQLLETKELWQKGEIKSYYSELTDIARTYIEEEIKIPAMESTTSELIVSLRKVANQKKLKISKETLENLEKVLMQADLVKFAKSKPQDFEIEEDKKRISNSIVTIHKSIPVVVEKTDELDLWNEEQKEKARLHKIKQQKRNKIIKAISLVILVIIITLGILIRIKGYDFVKDNLIGNPTKELVEGEWIYSEYGNPGVKIETPKVLKRVVDDNDKKSMFTNTQKFIYGNYLNQFSVILTTSKYKDPIKIPKLLELLSDATASKFEKEFKAKNIIVKNEEFQTNNNQDGMRVFGSMKINDNEINEDIQYDYEMLIFVQDEGVETLIVIYRNDDKYVKKLVDRIINSVELKQAEQ